MVGNYRGNGIHLFWGDVPVGDFDLRHFCRLGPALLIGEFKWVDQEIERDIKQKIIYTDIIKFLHPHVWIVYIAGSVTPDEQGRFLVKCERFWRLMPDGRLEEICIPNLPIKGGNVSSLLSYFKVKCRKEIFQKNIKVANDNVRFVPDYGRRKS